MISRPHFLVAFAIMQMSLAAVPVRPAAADDRDTSSIAEFVAARDRWDRLVGRPMRLEGRYTVLGASDLRFKNCDLDFVLTFRRPAVNTRNVEVAGQLIRKDGGLEFRVTDLKPRPSDAEQLALKRALLDSSRPDEVYELAEWARQRGKFYEDAELQQAGDRLFREGLTIAHQHLAAEDIVGLRDLAKKADDFSLDPQVRLRYLHEADRLEWKAAQAAAQQQPDYRRLLGMIARDLPGAGTPLPADRLAIRQDYKAAPVSVYRVADAATRRLLDRAFYLEVALAEILRGAADDGRNGYAIARRIEQDFPELSALADGYRRLELQYLTARLSRLTRTQMVDLSTRYKERGEEAAASAVVHDWLKAQENRAKQSGSTELMELGDEYVNLLRDEHAAARMYRLAYQQNPQLATAAEWLRTHGYELTGNQWTRPGEIEQDVDDVAIKEAIREGRIQVGMTAQQILQTLGTRPSSVVRMASSGQIAELWVFKDYGITVQLKRRTTTPTAHVVKIGTVD